MACGVVHSLNFWYEREVPPSADPEPSWGGGLEETYSCVD